MDPDVPSVECIVIHNERIADWGTRDDVKQRWGDKDVTGPVVGAPAASAKTGLKFKYLRAGEAAYPGFAGMCSFALSLMCTAKRLRDLF